MSSKDEKLEIVDYDSYEKLIKLTSSVDLSPDKRLITTSDPDVIVDPFSIVGFIKKRIRYLPQTEQQSILMKVQSIQRIRQRVSQYTKLTYGQHSQHESILEDYKVLDQYFGELIELFGKFYSIEDVINYMMEHHGYSFEKKVVDRWRRDNLQTIEIRQHEYKKDYGEIRLSNKKSRLEELQDLYTDRKKLYQGDKSKQNYELLLKTIDMIKKEVEVDVLRIEGDITQKIEHTISLQIERTIMNGLTLNDIVLARVCSRIGINPAYMISRLHTSYYSKFNGFGRPDNITDPSDQEMIYPSSMVYNWNEIDKIHSDKVLKDNELKVIPKTQDVTHIELLKDSFTEIYTQVHKRSTNVTIHGKA